MVSTHIDGPIDEKCLKALRGHLNAPDNLVLVHDKTNLNVGFSFNTSKGIGTQPTNLDFRRQQEWGA
jgi:hypothetical protein